MIQLAPFPSSNLESEFIEAEISSNSWGGHSESLALQQAIQVGIQKTECVFAGGLFFLLEMLKDKGFDFHDI